MLLRNVSHNAAVTFTNRSYIGVLHILHRLFHTVMSTVYQSEKYPLFDLLLPPSAAVAQGFPHPGANGVNRARRAASAALLKPSKKWQSHFSEKVSLRYVPHGRCAATSTHAPRKVCSATHMSRQNTDFIPFTSADVKLCEAFLNKPQGGPQMRPSLGKYQGLLLTPR